MVLSNDILNVLRTIEETKIVSGHLVRTQCLPSLLYSYEISYDCLLYTSDAADE